MIKYLIVMLIPFIIVYLLMPKFIDFAKEKGFVDKPTGRKKHDKLTPLIGGVVMYIGFFATYLFGIDSTRQLSETFTIFIASTLVIIIGVIDDYYKGKGKEFPIYPRVIIQILAATMVFKAGIVFRGISNPFTGEFVQFSTWAQYILTITWIFGVTTVINWSDGMDGLAGSISIISAMTMFVVALAKGQFNSAYMSITLVGSILAFLRYNRHPARVFMGDSGANFLGFILAIIALEGAFKQATVLSILVPVLALGVPIFDNIFVIFRRFQSGKPVYEADRSQIHYRLQEKGMTVKQIVSYICILSGCLSLVSLLIVMIIL
ncbi:MraY family glycosyltransferase [Clostridium sp. LIBA-8841]|uniref:MraY family glycosyltransferase n=1 Tax=Clostridium sp. LIBA-8841 TaxID=2987530 RepID=UPI00285C594C|nr:MraY family glycosyltransferase [Clostridium sp. LIBA-8841]ELC8441515.1 undecaprenyl/decaprenyl-phosphate alpha-N-acetylglucosaminyl 1-phosphate transferase [Clostridium perfringens]MDZ4991398.1 undecaprenyl/decaprenyl-phosphate alpha-N-acetylglucosaminyl 1-phosphate transferase [Clostridium perfringens]MDZ5252559.1 undecaprenyl/decaprenyl-phosphate alpha-N-acetylglucosaminyl 1-phosphate transferase [Clostridium sp. LIBA-8841]